MLYVIVILDFTPVPRDDYRIGVPSAGRYIEKLSSDDIRFGGSEYQTTTVAESDPSLRVVCIALLREDSRSGAREVRSRAHGLRSRQM